jgi:Cof subfamily protein (haloacid dehalogenase superfamily)
MSVRALFLDLDGTLVGAANTVSPAVRRAVAAARAKGCVVVLCTGRSRMTTEPVADQLGFRTHAIVSNGAVVLDLATREVLARNVLAEEHALGAIRALLAAGVAPQVYEDAIESARILYHPDYPVWIHNAHRQQPWPRLTECLPYLPICISSFGPEETLRPVADRLAAEPPTGTQVVQAGTHATWCLEIHHPDSGKHQGLHHVCRRLGVDPADTMAVGDHVNDIALLQAAGIGVAMGNALPEVRAAADHVTDTFERDGVAAAIERFVL